MLAKWEGHYNYITPEDVVDIGQSLIPINKLAASGSCSNSNNGNGNIELINDSSKAIGATLARSAPGEEEINIPAC